MRKYTGYIALIVGLLSLAVAAALVGRHRHRTSNIVFSCTWHVEYGTMPASDSELTDWLKSQPGVTEASVTREGKLLIVTCDVKGGQPMPKMPEKADTLGYADQRSFFGNVRTK
jgi:hypothetical protein